jgi:2'-5' RNA ligase
MSAASGTQGQLPLTLGAPRRRPKPLLRHNLFFAVLPDQEGRRRIAALVARLQNEYRLQAPPIAPERLHVSLHSLGAYANPPTDIIATAKEVGAAVDAPSFQVTFDRVLSFKSLGPAPLALAGGDGLAALMAFAKTLGTEMEKAGVACCPRSRFMPHVALLYDSHSVSEIHINPVLWTVREFVLVESLHGHRRHIHLARWPLRR